MITASFQTKNCTTNQSTNPKLKNLFNYLINILFKF
jgi:hypothetical protein